MHADCRVAEARILLRDLYRMFGLREIRASYHEFFATGIKGALNHIAEVGLMALGPVVQASVNGIGKVDAYLECQVSIKIEPRRRMRTNINISQLRRLWL